MPNIGNFILRTKHSEEQCPNFLYLSWRNFAPFVHYQQCPLSTSLLWEVSLHSQRYFRLFLQLSLEVSLRSRSPHNLDHENEQYHHWSGPVLKNQSLTDCRNCHWMSWRHFRHFKVTQFKARHVLSQSVT